jgi:glycosyltransferase involved in cell wall biosynthesis
MRIVVDASCWGNNRGFGRFTRELVGEMTRRDARNDYVLLSDDALPLDGLGPRVEAAPVRTGRRVIDAATADGRRGLRDVLAFRRAAAAARPDVLFFPAVYSWFPPPRGVPTAVTFHDAIAEHFPELVFPHQRQRLAWTLKTWAAKRSADRVLTVSESAKAEIERYLHIPGRRIDVICEGAAPAFAPVEAPGRRAAARAAAGLEPGTRFLVYVGGFAPHKNLVRLFEAFDRVLAEPDLSDLVLVMSGDPKGGGFHSIHEQLQAQMAASPRLAGRVRFPGYLSDADLAALYSQTLALVLPSLSEGFGLPALEAMSCGAPVLGAAGGAVMEVAGAAGLGFDPYDPDSIAAAIGRIARDRALSDALRARALPETRRNTWAKAADLAVAALESCARSRGRGAPGRGAQAA